MRSIPEIQRADEEAERKYNAAKWRTHLAAADLLERAAQLIRDNGPSSWPQAHSLANAAFEFESVGGFDSYIRTLRRCLKMDDSESVSQAVALRNRMPDIPPAEKLKLRAKAGAK